MELLCLACVCCQIVQLMSYDVCWLKGRYCCRMKVPWIEDFRWILFAYIIKKIRKKPGTPPPPSLSTLYIHNSPSFWIFPFDFQLSSKEVKFKLMFFISHTKWKSLTLSLNWLVSFFFLPFRECVLHSHQPGTRPTSRSTSNRKNKRKNSTKRYCHQKFFRGGAVRCGAAGGGNGVKKMKRWKCCRKNVEFIFVIWLLN